MPIANHNPYLENQEVRQSSIVNTFLNTQNCITTQITEAHTNNKYTNYTFRSIACNKQSRAENGNVDFHIHVKCSTEYNIPVI